MRFKGIRSASYTILQVVVDQYENAYCYVRCGCWMWLDASGLSYWEFNKFLPWYC